MAKSIWHMCNNWKKIIKQDVVCDEPWRAVKWRIFDTKIKQMHVTHQINLKTKSEYYYNSYPISTQAPWRQCAFKWTVWISLRSVALKIQNTFNYYSHRLENIDDYDI